MKKNEIAQAVESGQTALGIEFGSTRIKGVLIDEDHNPIATGSHTWENRLEDGLWTYSLDNIWSGLQACYQALQNDVRQKYDTPLTTVGAIGLSGMMHGYMAFDANKELLVPFRTWRNTNTGPAAAALTQLFQFNIPLRWSIAHLHQAVIDQENHLSQIAYITTLAGYVHWSLTGEQVLGVGEASGMFPIDSETNRFDAKLLDQYSKHIEAYQMPWRLEEILPTVLTAGELGGELTAAGAKQLDPSGQLQPGIPLCPPEGDAGTGMVATNSVAARSGNVSAGTSIFAMIVLEKGLSALHPEIDMVSTPAGKPVAMVHANTCTSDLNAWVGLFKTFADLIGAELSEGELFEILFKQAVSPNAAADGGRLLAYNFFAGEPVVDIPEGRPLFVRMPDSSFTLPNFMRTHLFAALGTLRIGMDILFEEEGVEIDGLLGHGGFFKTKGVAQSLMASALNIPVSVMESAGEGGAWGIGLLAAYMRHRGEGEPLENYLQQKVFNTRSQETGNPIPADAAGFETFMKRYKNGLAIAKAAGESLKENDA